MAQRPRGERRVAELLEAAAATIAEVGYEAATMKAISRRAGASVGAVYQYFPDKEAVVRALRTQYGARIDAEMVPLLRRAAGLTIRELAEGLFALVVDLMERWPAFVALLAAPRQYGRDPEAKFRLRERFGALFRQKRPSLGKREAFRIANVTLQILWSLDLLYADADAAERTALRHEFTAVLTAYLTARLDSGD
ncbi:MAG: TetR/AcrR family transcriptional regulator [Gluconacetobacter diazotrophicus]|nr:TetR/AcrR family transcriptional regulator [Gluconacetobacter diazotrophicus]